MRLSLLYHFVLALVLGALLSGCAATRDIEIETQTPDTMESDTGEGGVEETRTDLYPDEIASTARRLYGEELEVSSNETYLQAAQEDPALRYNIIYFDYNSSVVKDQGRAVLKRHAGFLEKHPDAALRIEGHADERGSAGYNLALGEKRAKAVRDIMQAYGIETARISTISYGEERPAIEEQTEEAYGRNRRAELVYQ